MSRWAYKAFLHRLTLHIPLMCFFSIDLFRNHWKLSKQSQSTVLLNIFVSAHERQIEGKLTEKKDIFKSLLLE